MKYLINLLPEKKQNTSDRIIYFSFHYLRYILVITQFVAICVFFYRFKVDQEIVDLRDTLIQKRAIVDATQSLLDEVKTVDGKMKQVKILLTQQEATQAIYTYVFERLPPSISIHKLFIKDQIVDIEGVCQDIAIVKQVYEQIKAEKRFLKVDLTSINKTKDGYSFKLTLAQFK